MGDSGQFCSRSTRRAWWCLGLACLAAAGVARADGTRVDLTVRPHIVNGLDTHAYPTTGAMLYSPGGPITKDNASIYCSGTLIGCETFLVAAHCAADPNPSHYAVYLQHGGIVPVVAVTRNPLYADATFPKHDVAVLKLGATVTGIAPSALAATAPAPLLPLSGTIVGFGQTQAGASDYGVKRVGAVLAESCPGDIPAGATDTDVVCWNFSASPGPAGTDSNTCNGDSGGPLFLDLGGGPALAGVTSGGMTQSCLGFDTGYDANVFTNRGFILDQLGSDSTATCGGLAPVGDSSTLVVEHDGTLNAANPSDTYTMAIPAGATALRVTLNGKDNGVFDPDLYVKAGAGASPTDSDCAENGASAFGACTFDLPAPGTWSIAVVRYAGIGNYQLTATLFGGTSPSCGNGTREFTETCDGGDAALCPGLCQGDCTCPAPVCGNDIAEQGEACDGSDAPLCPGQCTACQCPVPCGQNDLTGISAHLSATRFKVRSLLLNFDAAFTGVDPRQHLTLVLTQGAATATVDIPANDPGWARSRPERGRYLWSGSINGISKVKAIDRSAHNGTWKLIVVGKNVPGGGTFDSEQPIDLTLTMGADARCATGTSP